MHAVDQAGGGLVEVTYPEAVSDLLGHVTSHVVHVGAHSDSVGVWRYVDGQPVILADYRATDYEEFDLFSQFASIVQELLRGLQNEFDKSVECYTPGALANLMRRRSQGRPYPPFTPEAHQSANNLLRYATGWLLGREVKVPLAKRDDHAALCLALECELQDGTPLEITFAQLRSA